MSGQELRKIRTSNRISQQDVADRAGWLQCLVSRIESFNPVPKDYLERYVQALIQILEDAAQTNRTSIQSLREIKIMPGPGMKVMLGNGREGTHTILCNEFGLAKAENLNAHVETSEGSGFPRPLPTLLCVPSMFDSLEVKVLYPA